MSLQAINSLFCDYTPSLQEVERFSRRSALLKSMPEESDSPLAGNDTPKEVIPLQEDKRPTGRVIYVELLGSIRLRINCATPEMAASLASLCPGGVAADRTVQIGRFRTRAAGSLLGYLAYRIDEWCDRDTLTGIFWPDQSRNSGRNNLNLALSSLRRLLTLAGTDGEKLLQSDRSGVCLMASSVVTDVQEFEELMRIAGPGLNLSSAGEAIATLPTNTNLPQRLDNRALIDVLHRVIRLYRGPLMHGFDEEWVVGGRVRFQDQYLLALRRLVGLERESGNFTGALHVAYAGVEAEPFDEANRCILMQLLLEMDQAALAVRQFREYRRFLRQSGEPLELEPDGNGTIPLELNDLYQEALRRVSRQKPKVQTPAPALLPSRPELSRDQRLNNSPVSIHEASLRLKRLLGEGSPRTIVLQVSPGWGVEQVVRSAIGPGTALEHIQSLEKLRLVLSQPIAEDNRDRLCVLLLSGAVWERAMTPANAAGTLDAIAEAFVSTRAPKGEVRIVLSVCRRIAPELALSSKVASLFLAPLPPTVAATLLRRRKTNPATSEAENEPLLTRIGERLGGLPLFMEAACHARERISLETLLEVADTCPFDLLKAAEAAAVRSEMQEWFTALDPSAQKTLVDLSLSLNDTLLSHSILERAKGSSRTPSVPILTASIFQELEDTFAVRRVTGSGSDPSGNPAWTITYPILVWLRDRRQKAARAALKKFANDSP